MKIKRSLFWISIPLLLAIVILGMGGAAAGVAAETASPNGGMITGTVTSPDSYPLPVGTLVRLFEPGSDEVRGIAQPDLDTGAFSLGPVPNGLYIIKAVPPAGSGLTQSEPAIVSVANAPVNVGDLALTTPQIIGTVTAPDGTTPADGEVLVFAGDGTLFQRVDAPSGAFLVGGLPLGSYALKAFPVGNLPYWNSEFAGVSITATNTQTLILSLTDADLWGTVEDGLGNPVPNAVVVAMKATGERETDRSNGDGYWSIGGLSPGFYWITALPPLHNIGLITPAPILVPVPGASNPYTITFDSPAKTVTGTVQTNTGSPVENAEVVAHRVNLSGRASALTGSDGAYQLDLAPGLWALTVHPISSTTPLDWVYPDPPQFVHFKHNNLPENQQMDFTVLTADATVNGVVEMPDSSPPPFTVTVGLHNGEGIGRATEIDPADGSFQLSLPNGVYKVVVHPEDEGYLGPSIDPVNLPPNGTLDLGTITLVPRDAVITGTINVKGGSGVEGVPVVAWRSGIAGNVRTFTGPGGIYALGVTTGTWHIQPAPAPDQPYLFTGEADIVTISSGETISNVDFELLNADATISGVLVDEAGDPVPDADGWAVAVQTSSRSAGAIQNGAPIIEGGFDILVPGGTYNVAAYLPAGSPYLSTGEQQVTVGSGESVTITLTVREKDASIAGALVDHRNNPGQAVTGVPGLVGAWSDSSWAATHINTGNGTFQMDVASGLWHLNYRIGSDDYVKIGGARNVPVQSGQTVLQTLAVTLKDAAIEGTVLDPSGTPLPGATVLAHGLGDDLNGLWLNTRSQSDGTFHLDVPYGRYVLGATMGSSGWIKPVEYIVNVSPGTVSTGHVLQFQEPDAVISGTLTVSNTLSEGEALVWAWSEDGGFVKGAFPVTQTSGTATGPYQLDVISGTVWHVGAVFETRNRYWAGRSQVEVTSTQATLDLVLTGPHTKPAPVVVTFDAANPQRVVLEDGTAIFIPGGAMPVTGTVTLRIVPIATLPHQKHASILRYGYAFLATDENGAPIEDHFNQDVVIRFAYDDTVLHGFPEQWLKPAYFSTTTDQWTFPDSYVIDTDANQVVMQIDHFTDFALMAGDVFTVNLPVLMR